MDRDLAKDIKPNNKPDEVICGEMKTYFKENIERIYSSIEEDVASRPTIYPQEEPSFQGKMLNKFESIDEEGLMTILSEFNKKECESDPIPVKLLLQCFDEAKLILLYIRGENLSR